MTVEHIKGNKALLSYFFNIKVSTGEVVVAQLVERPLSIPEVHGLTPGIEKTKINKKRPGNTHFFLIGR